MYCPSCDTSIEPTDTECPACGAELDRIQPGPPPDPNIQMTPVLSTGDQAVIALAKSLLESEGIEYFVRAEGLQDLFGWGRLGFAYNIVAGPAQFVVRNDDAEHARELLSDLVTPTGDDDGADAGDPRSLEDQPASGDEGE
jgi:hypothetical protein